MNVVQKGGVKILIIFILGFAGISLGQSKSTIVLGPIEGELARKQVPLDLGNTLPGIAPLASRAINVHGGLRLETPKKSKFSISLIQQGQNSLQLTIAGGLPKKPLQSITLSGESSIETVFKAMDLAVVEILGIPGFFSGKLSYLSDLGGKKEIFVSNALMSSARPQTSFQKITFNPSWDNQGTGIFFTSNRKVFNNVYHLDLTSRKISTIASYKGSNLRAVQNPRTQQVALILSASGNPDVWLAETAKSRPRKLTNNRSNESGPCWSPDGRRMIVTSDSRGKPQLYEVSLSTGKLMRIPTNISSHCTEAAWNPVDANRIAFTAAVGGNFQICEYNFSSRKSKILTRGKRDGMQPAWAIDGRHLYFTERSSSGPTRIMILDTEFEEAKPIMLHDASFGNCSQVSFYKPS
ncbi:MAG: hypothetical protein CMI27_04600 [Opitutae bacterium]|nr:hypothetical protein [Opitutae bacterium]